MMDGVVKCGKKILETMKASIFALVALAIITLALSSCQVFSITQQVVL